MEQSLHIITGPTGVGKTEFALSYAERLGAEIVSCDASLFYRGMDIGTAKPTPAELARVPHHLIDLCAVNEPFDIVAYDAIARETVAEIAARGLPVIVTGGSGFYLKSFLEPVVDTIIVPEEVRERVSVIERERGLEGLLECLRAESPDTGSLDTQNPRRVSRALERCLAAGRTLPELQAEFASRPKPYPDFEKKVIFLERDRAELEERVTRRATLMLEQGLVQEVETLMELGIEKNPSAAAAIGYRETIAFLSGRLAEEELLGQIIRNTMKLVKKQRTWFRTQITHPNAERYEFGG